MRSTGGTVPSPARQLPHATATVLPGQLPTRWRAPVSALNRVDLPVFGLPTRATRAAPVPDSVLAEPPSPQQDLGLLALSSTDRLHPQAGGRGAVERGGGVHVCDQQPAGRTTPHHAQGGARHEPEFQQTEPTPWIGLHA